MKEIVKQSMCQFNRIAKRRMLVFETILIDIIRHYDFEAQRSKECLVQREQAV